MRAWLLKWLPQAAVYVILPALALVTWGELAAMPAAVELYLWDKLLHFIAYFGLSGFLCVAFKGDRRVLTSTLLIALFGAVLELLQGCAGRDPSLYDEMANTLGAVSGAAVGWLALRLLKAKSLAPRVPS